VIQGAFVPAKAGTDPELVRVTIEHLDRYTRLFIDHSIKEYVMP
jgi:hypothetical protein